MSAHSCGPGAIGERAVPQAEPLQKPLDGIGWALTSLDAMRHGDTWDDEAARRYDTPGTGMFAPEVLGPVVDRLAEFAGDGRALEFAIGTGRVAVPRAQRGVSVTGVEL